MQGVEILNKEPIMIQNEKLCIVGMMILIIAVISSFIAIKIKDDVLGNGFAIIFALCLFISLILAVLYKTVEIPSDRYQYEAIIDDDVSINEVYKYYDVIEQKGKKWILEDKEK